MTVTDAATAAPAPTARLAAIARPLALGVYVAVFLYVDSRLQSIAAQAAMGVMTFAVLLGCGFRLRPLERRQLCLLILYATALELFSSQLWGVYRYRFGNVPFYIPPGHGIVFVLSIWLARSPLLLRAPHRTIRLVLVAAGTWAVAGVTFLPALTGRVDLEGFLLWPIFLGFVLRRDRAPFFAAVFLVTSAVEIYGVALGDWSWTPVAPHLGIPGGNPPSVIAGAYSLLDLSVFGSIALISRHRLPRRAWDRWARLRSDRPAVRLVGGPEPAPIPEPVTPIEPSPFSSQGSRERP